MAPRHELADRHRQLLEQCDIQRDAAVLAAASLAIRLSSIDRGLERVRHWPLKSIAALALAGLFVSGRLRSLPRTGAALGLFASAMRVLRLTSRMRGRRPALPSVVKN